MVRDVDDYWDDYDPPDDPYSVFNNSLHEAWVLLDEKGGDGSSLINRMVFAHYIGAFEAFLADTLINQVQVSSKALDSLIAKDKTLREMKFSLTEIRANPALIAETVRSRLRRQMWHNIKNASALYNISFGIDLLASLGADSAFIEKAIEHRHDCVHRNGHDKDGTELAVFEKDYIDKVGSILSRVAREVVDRFTVKAEDFFAPISSAESAH